MAEATEKQATEEKKKSDNKVTIEDAGPCRKKIKIEVPAASVDEQLGDSVETLMAEAQIPGFRQGRAPKRLVERRFGSVVRREAKNQIVATAYTDAVEDAGLKVIGDPISEGLGDIELEDGKPLTFEVEVEVLPEFDLPPLDGIEVKKPILEVTDEQVDEEFSRLSMNEGRLEPRDKPEPGDYLTGHAKMTGKDGTVHLDIEDAVIQVPTPDKEGKGMILGIVVDDFADQIGLPDAGQSVTVKATGPENHEVEAIRGDDLTIEFTVARIDRIVPATGEELASRFGMENESQIRDVLRTRMQQRVGVEQQSVMRQQVAKHLLDGVEMEMPERVTAQQAARNLVRRRLDMLQKGMSETQIEEQIAELRRASNDVAVRELKLFFTLEKASESLDVKVTEGEINGRIAQMAMMRGERPEKLRQQLIQQNQIGQVFLQIREHKTLDAILEKAKVEEIGLEAFNDYMRQQAGESAPSTEAAAKSPGKKKPSEKKSGGKKSGSKEG